MKIIKRNSVSYDEIRKNVTDYLESLDNYDDIKDALPASNLTIIKDLIAGFGEYITYSHRAHRGESALSTAKLNSSVYEHAKSLGYYISRYTCPSIKFKYIGVDTFNITSGVVIGKYGSLDVVYFGVPNTLEKLDELDVCIGRCEEVEQDVVLQDGVYITSIKPKHLKSVDEDNVHLFINDELQSISHDIEDYVAFNKPVDFSQDPYTTTLFISDSQHSYGGNVETGDRVTLKYIETNGYRGKIDLLDIKMDNLNFIPIQVNHTGSNGESVDKIRQLAPLYYSTLRRMVTERDHQYVTEAHSYIKSASSERAKGQPLTIDFAPNAPYTNKTFSFDVDGISVSTTSDGTGTLESILEALYLIAKRVPYYELEKRASNLRLTSLDSRKDNHSWLPTANMSRTIVHANVKPPCCTVEIHYVLNTTRDEPVVLTPFEQRKMATYLKPYKMVGVRVVLKPAEVQYKDFKILIRLSDSKYLTETRKEILKILASYELLLNKEFSYGGVLVKLGQVQVKDVDGTMVNPITSVIPDQPTFDIKASPNTYLKFKNTSIKLS